MRFQKCVCVVIKLEYFDPHTGMTSTFSVYNIALLRTEKNNKN